MSHKTTLVITDPTTWPGQLTLPGQSHTADGPHDQTGMYVMHHAFRRDLDAFRGRRREHPGLGDRRCGRRSSERWLRMADVLHHHHRVEDEALWPVLRRHAQEAGNAEDLTMLEDMEAEHGVIDPALAAVRSAFEEMSAHPCADHRNALEIRVAAARESLHEHLAHEEGQALPMLQRTLSVAENDAFEKAASPGLPAAHRPVRAVAG